MKILAADYDTKARAMLLTETVEVVLAVKDADGIETKPAEMREDVIGEAKEGEKQQRITVVPVDADGKPLDWSNIRARAGYVTTFHRLVDYEPDPKSTEDKPLPPLKNNPIVEVRAIGAQKGAIMAKLSARLAAKATVEAAKELPAPVEGEIEGKVIPK